MIVTGLHEHCIVVEVTGSIKIIVIPSIQLSCPFPSNFAEDGF
jgi:hypothetical protein